MFFSLTSRATGFYLHESWMGFLTPAKEEPDMVAHAAHAHHRTFEHLHIAAAAVLEVNRRATVARGTDSVVDDRLPPVRLPSLDIESRIGQLAELALSDVEAHVLQILVASELDPKVHRALHQLSGSRDGGFPVESVINAVRGMGVSELEALAALGQSGTLVS